MDNKIISIVIPSYNMEDYLSRSVGSLLDDRINDYIEIIIVNDGSTDSTGRIAREYSTKYPQSIVAYDKPNGHYGSAVNAGISLANGKYIKVLDADDWFDKENFVNFVINLRDKETADVIFTRWSINDTSKGVVSHSLESKNKIGEKMDIKDIVWDSRPYSFYSFYGITYLTDLLKRIDYHQTEGVCYTDTEYSLYPLLKAQNAMFLDLDVYQYFIGRDGQTITKEAIKKNIGHLFKIYTRMVESFDDSLVGIKRTFETNQLLLIAQSLYVSYLFFNNKNDVSKYNLSDLDSKLKIVSEEAYKKVGAISKFGIPYIWIWRKTGWRFNKIYSAIMNK